ncbi:MAG: helix-turn-helix domain-containing protein [Lentisphaeria bacterium]|nr:helix-turn-helix domain-containing protein [Lentisphaeria bacterium]
MSGASGRIKGLSKHGAGIDKALRGRVSLVLDEVFRHTGYGGIFHSFNETLPHVTGRGFCRFCNACSEHPQTMGFCRSAARTGAVQGHAIGDVWFFRCWLGLDSLAIAVAPKGDIIGAIEVGGFFSPGGTEEAQQTILSRLNTLTPGSLGRLPLDALQGVRELNFKQVRAAADFLTQATFACGLNQPAQFQTKKRIHKQRERLARRTRELHVWTRPAHEALLESLIPLVGAVNKGDRRQASRELDNFLGAVLLRSEGKLERVKAAMALLVSAFLREDVDRGNVWKSAIRRFEERLLDVEKIDAVEEAFLWAEDMVGRVCAHGGAGSDQAKGSERLSDKVLRWMDKRYADKVTLADAAGAVAASPSTITHRLKVETGKSFSEHLTALRISEAKRLLVYTDLSLREISIRCGFSEQSYFTKVFRRLVNLTPGEFRGMLNQERP